MFPVPNLGTVLEFASKDKIITGMVDLKNEKLVLISCTLLQFHYKIYSSISCFLKFVCVVFRSASLRLQVDGNSDVETIPDDIEDNFGDDEVDNCRENDSDGIWPVIWDFAGQAVYRAIHPIFMSPGKLCTSWCLIYQRICSIRQEEIGETISPCLILTARISNLDHIMRWMDMVHSLEYSSDAETLPPVILVGTHADSVQGRSQQNHGFPVRPILQKQTVR